jgi:hypothetical protein
MGDPLAGRKRRAHSESRRSRYFPIAVAAVCAAYLLAQGCSAADSTTAEVEVDPVATVTSAFVPSPIMGTLGYQSSSDQLVETWDIGDNTLMGGTNGWRIMLGDKLVKNRTADFDGDGYDDVIVTSAWGMGVLGTNATTWTMKTKVQFGTDIGLGWNLSPEDQVAAVGVFATPPAAAMMVLQHKDKGVAFVKLKPNGAGFQAVSKKANNTNISGSGQNWTVRYGDRLFNAGRLKGAGDAIVVLGDAGMGVYHPSMTGDPTLIARTQNGTRWQVSGMDYRLYAEDARLRAYGGDIDLVDNRAELVLTGPSGLAVFHMNDLTPITSTTPWDLRFQLLDGKPFPGTSV